MGWSDYCKPKNILGGPTCTRAKLKQNIGDGCGCITSCRNIFYYLIFIGKKGYGCKWTWETIQHYTWTQIKVKEQHFYCCLTFHSHSSIFNNELNSYPITSVIPSLELSDTHYENTSYGHLCCFVISMLFDVEGGKRDVYILVLFHETSHFNVQYMYWLNGLS